MICHVKRLPNKMDVSCCSNINLDASCLEQVGPLTFAENAHVSMDMVTHLHPETDFSKCLTVNLNDAEFGDYDNPFPKALRFKSRTDVSLRNAANLPEHLNVSSCRSINLALCDLHNLRELRFGLGADVSLCRAENLPPIVDVAGCEKVDCEKADWHRTERLIFRNRKQMEECASLILPEDWKGQIFFKDEMVEGPDKYQEEQNVNLALLKLKGEGR